MKKKPSIRTGLINIFDRMIVLNEDFRKEVEDVMFYIKGMKGINKEMTAKIKNIQKFLKVR